MATIQIRYDPVGNPDLRYLNDGIHPDPKLLDSRSDLQFNSYQFFTIHRNIVVKREDLYPADFDPSGIDFRPITLPFFFQVHNCQVYVSAVYQKLGIRE